VLVFENYARFAKYECRHHLKAFEADRFWTTMANSFLAYDVVLKAAAIELATCDQYMEGTYVADENRIILCSNVLTKKDDFNNATKR